MVRLYDVIMEAHSLAKQRNKGRPVRFVTIDTDYDYFWNKGGKRITINARFGRFFQRLVEAEVSLADLTQSQQPFTPEELERIIGSVPTSFFDFRYFILEGMEGCSARETFELRVIKTSIYKTARFKFHSGDAQVDYQELAGMFGLDLNTKDNVRALQFPREIDPAKVSEAYQWIYNNGFSPHLSFSHSKGKSVSLSCHPLTDGTRYKNRFALEDRAGEWSIAMAPEQVDALELQVRAYRHTDPDKTPLKLSEFVPAVGEKEYLSKQDIWLVQPVRD